MQTSFPFVEIPAELESIIGKPDPGTHIYRRDGSQEESAAWFDLLTEIIGPSVSPGGVGMYCPASRAAVYKRIKEGKLSIFLFHVTYRKTTLFGKNKILRDNPYGYIPVSEAKAWRQELEERAIRQGRITAEELEGARPDWHGEFLQWRNKKERLGFFDAMDVEGVGRIEAVRSLAKALLSPTGEAVISPSRKKSELAMQGERRITVAAEGESRRRSRGN
jgi:hypothetical protein